MPSFSCCSQLLAFENEIIIEFWYQFSDFIE